MVCLMIEKDVVHICIGTMFKKKKSKRKRGERIGVLVQLKDSKGRKKK